MSIKCGVTSPEELLEPFLKRNSSYISPSAVALVPRPRARNCRFRPSIASGLHARVLEATGSEACHDVGHVGLRARECDFCIFYCFARGTSQFSFFFVFFSHSIRSCNIYQVIVELDAPPRPSPGKEVFDRYGVKSGGGQ